MNPAPQPECQMELVPLRDGFGAGRFLLVTWVDVFQSGQVDGQTADGTWNLICPVFRALNPESNFCKAGPQAAGCFPWRCSGAAMAVQPLRKGFA